MRDQIECIQNLAIHMQAELNEINERCKLALAKESQNTSTNTDSTKFSEESKKFIGKLFRSQIDLPPDIAEAVNEHFWELL